MTCCHHPGWHPGASASSNDWAYFHRWLKKELEAGGRQLTGQHFDASNILAKMRKEKATSSGIFYIGSVFYCLPTEPVDPLLCLPVNCTGLHNSTTHNVQYIIVHSVLDASIFTCLQHASENTKRHRSKMASSSFASETHCCDVTSNLPGNVDDVIVLDSLSVCDRPFWD